MQQTARQGRHDAARARRPQLRALPARWPRRSNVSNDDFIRTTEAAPLPLQPGDLEARWQANGDIYLRQLCRLVLGARRGLLRRGRDRSSARTACAAGRRARRSNGSRRRAISSAFRLSGQAARRSTRASPDFIGPPERRNEVVSFVKCGLQDLSISRTTFDWGMPVPGDAEHVMYVWVDALTNYITGVGFPDESDAERGATGRPTCTSSARTSCASTRSTGRPS